MNRRLTTLLFVALAPVLLLGCQSGNHAPGNHVSAKASAENQAAVAQRANGSTSAVPPASTVRAEVEEYMRAAVKQEHFMGVVLVARGPDVFVSKGYGAANIQDNEPNTPDTAFALASVTKQFTAMSILLLQSEGKLNVHDSVCKYVKDCPKDWQPITLSMLLTHSSGIPDYLNSVPPKVSDDIMSKPATPAQLIAMFKNRKLDFKPGAKYSYSNSGYVLLGHIIENVSGESYEKFLQQHIFNPLDMTASGYGDSYFDLPKHATGYRWRSGKYRNALHADLTSAFSAGGVYSTVGDLYKWDRILNADTGKLIPASLQQQMFTPRVRVTGDIVNFYDIKNPISYGYGWYINNEFGNLEYSHEGGLPGFTTFNSWFPKQHLYVIVLDNGTSPYVFQIAKSLAAMSLGASYSVPHAFKAISMPPRQLAKFVGMYQMGPVGLMEITQKSDHLEAKLRDQPPLKIYPETDSRFFYKKVRAQIFFKLDDSGNVTGLALKQNGLRYSGKRLTTAEAKRAAMQPKQIALPSRTLQKFVGIYDTAAKFSITVTRKGDQLYAQVTGQPSVPIYPQSTKKFFYKVVRAQISFKEDSSGKVTGLVLHQNGNNISAKRTDSGAAH